jgi:hypothetical protein
MLFTIFNGGFPTERLSAGTANQSVCVFAKVHRITAIVVIVVVLMPPTGLAGSTTTEHKRTLSELLVP